jgi:hypothetical protein
MGEVMIIVGVAIVAGAVGGALGSALTFFIIFKD